MIKKDLLKLRALPATKKMMEMACSDEPREEWTCHSSNRSGQRCKNQLFMRCQVLQGILKVSFFYGKILRAGLNQPAFDLFINKETGQWLTYDYLQKMWRTAKLDMLPWKECSLSPWYSCPGRTWITPEGYSSIKKYLGTEHGGYKGILEYQQEQRAEELKRRYRRETDPWDLENAQVPPKPADWDKWVNKVGIPENFIFYNYQKGGAKTGYCTYCEKEVPIRNAKHNQKGRCSCCHHEITFKARGKQKVVKTENYQMYLIQKIESGFVVREFSGYRKWKSEDMFSCADAAFWEHHRAFYDKNARRGNTYCYGDYKHHEIRWYEVRINDCAEQGKVYGKTIPCLTKNELKHTGLQEFIRMREKVDPIIYLAKLQRIPALEKMVKAKLPKLAEDVISGHFNYYNLGVCTMPWGTPANGKGSLTEILKINNNQLKRLRANNGGHIFLQWLIYERKVNRPVSDEIILYFEKNHILPQNLSFIEKQMSIVQTYNYIKRQTKEMKISAGEVLTLWEDYLSMAKKLGMDVNDAIVYRASKLRQRHDELVLQSKRKDMETEAKTICKRFPHVEEILQEIRDLYSFTGEVYQVVVPESVADIMVEGSRLHHCVGNSDRYYDRIERRESYILFLRKTAEPDRAYYTLEIEPDGTVRQKRTMYDRQQPDIEDATKFLKQWQKTITKRLTSKERTLAKKSKALRMEGFQQMRKDQVMIHTGDLRGKLLVDVLMADLMENEEDKTA